MRGYLYVLVNSSFPGLVKVGKTSRLPSERVHELSSVTGVPTPFVVAFEQLFADCDSAEQQVHAALELKGYRQASNREFFRCSSAEAVRAVLSVRSAIDSAELENELPPGSNNPASPSSDDLSALALENHIPPEPWDDILEEAQRHEHGYDGYLEDASEAYRNYRDAARLGSPEAYRKLGEMHLHGNGVSENHAKALDYLKEAARRGNYYAYCDMASLFAVTRQQENFEKCIAKFFENRRLHHSSRIEKSSTGVHIALLSLVQMAQWRKWPIPCKSEVANCKEEILRACDRMRDPSPELPQLAELGQAIRDVLAVVLQETT